MVTWEDLGESVWNVLFIKTTQLLYRVLYDLYVDILCITSIFFYKRYVDKNATNIKFIETKYALMGYYELNYIFTNINKNNA